MKKFLLMSTIVAAFIIFQPETAKAQIKRDWKSHLPIVIRIFAEVFKPTPLNEGEDEIVEKMKRDYEEKQKAQEDRRREIYENRGCGRRCESDK